MDGASEAGDGLLNRGELEIELAYFALRLARRNDPALQATVGSWIQAEATALVARVMPEHRPWAGDRVRQLAQSIAGVDVSLVDVSYGLKAFEANSPSRVHPTSDNDL